MIRIAALIAFVLCGCGARTPLSVDEDASIVDASANPVEDTRVTTEVFVPEDTGAPTVTIDAMPFDAGCPGPTQCTDEKDNDGDGLIDWMDPECTFPGDNDESSFSSGIPGDNIDPCKIDCWFDGNSGSGNDGCIFAGRCLPGSTDPRCPYSPAAAADPKQCPPQSDKCRSVCEPLTPNGCDCAGCCDVFDKLGRSTRVRIVSGCTAASLGDPTKCPPCEKVPDCGKPCGRCDYCLGKWAIPSDCTDADKTACPAGAKRCGPGNPCACGEYCLTGCCVRAFE